MGQIIKEEDEKYGEFMEKVCLLNLKHSVKIIRDVEKEIDVSDNINEIHLSVGQALEDDIIEITKDMSREEIVKMLSRVSMAHSVNLMQSNSLLKIQLLKRSGLL